jgi:putative SOS response-associated peptidase YedK
MLSGFFKKLIYTKAVIAPLYAFFMRERLIMCGRFVLMASPRKVAEHFDVAETVDFSRRYNIAPSQLILAVIKHPEEFGRRIRDFRWGLVPFWEKDETIGTRLINGRSETIAQKPAFRKAFKTRRCLVPANGFYEWEKGSRPRRPYFIGLEGDALFGMAAVWDEWLAPENGLLRTCSIVTTDSNELIKGIHDRMPVIVHPKDYGAWLETKPLAPEEAARIFRPFPGDLMRIRAVSPKVNQATYDSSDCIESLDDRTFAQGLLEL